MISLSLSLLYNFLNCLAFEPIFEYRYFMFKILKSNTLLIFSLISFFDGVITLLVFSMLTPYFHKAVTRSGFKASYVKTRNEKTLYTHMHIHTYILYVCIFLNGTWDQNAWKGWSHPCCWIMKSLRKSPLSYLLVSNNLLLHSTSYSFFLRYFNDKT